MRVFFIFNFSSYKISSNYCLDNWQQKKGLISKSTSSNLLNVTKKSADQGGLLPSSKFYMPTLNHRELLCEILGVETSVTDELLANSAKSFQDEILNFQKDTTLKIEKLTNSEKVAKEEAKTATTRVEVLTNSNKMLSEELVNYDLAKYAPVIGDAVEAKQSLLNNRTAAIAMLKNSAAAASKVNADKAGKQPLHNSREVQPKNVLANGGATASAAEDISDVDAKKIMNRARELQKTGKMLNFQSAVAAARGEFTKLQN